MTVAFPVSSRFPAALLAGLGATLAAGPAWADALTGPTTRQSLNPIAISMFLAFVAVTLGITFWAARRGTRTASDYYAAGGGLSGFKNGLAIAGDYTSARHLPRRHRPGLHVGLRRHDLRDRLPGRVSDDPVPDRRTAPQPRPLHLRRCRGLSPVGGSGPDGRRHQYAGHRPVLPDRAVGRRRQADRAAVRAALLHGGRDGRHPDDGST